MSTGISRGKTSLLTLLDLRVLGSHVPLNMDVDIFSIQEQYVLLITEPSPHLPNLDSLRLPIDFFI